MVHFRCTFITRMLVFAFGIMSVMGYDDSDFHMIVWNERTQSTEDICFASTRGWTYPSYGSFADARDDVKAAYKAFREANERRARVQSKLSQRALYKKLARAVSEFNYLRALPLIQAIPVSKREAAIELLTNPRIRSKFKLSLRSQILDWYASADRRYNSPLSPRQWDYV